jgi:hypothetical protein
MASRPCRSVPVLGTMNALSKGSGNSIQKHILRDYIMKYSNLGTMTYKVEHGGK